MKSWGESRSIFDSRDDLNFYRAISEKCFDWRCLSSVMADKNVTRNFSLDFDREVFVDKVLVLHLAAPNMGILRCKNIANGFNILGLERNDYFVVLLSSQLTSIKTVSSAFLYSTVKVNSVDAASRKQQRQYLCQSNFLQKTMSNTFPTDTASSNPNCTTITDYSRLQNDSATAESSRQEARGRNW